MDDVEDQCGTDPAPSADNLLEMRTTPLGRYLARAMHHQQRLAAGDDPLDVDVAIIAETREFLNTAGIQLPSGQCLRGLSDVLDGRPSAYFNRHLPHRAALTARQQLVVLAAFWIEALIFSRRAFATKAAATLEVVGKLNASIVMPDSGRFCTETVGEWHVLVVWKAKQRTDVERQMYDLQWEALKRIHPDHAGWDRDQATQWLNDQVKQLAGLGYFEKTKRKQSAGRRRKPPS